ncbi:MAG TPA: response regulator, partial [Candidatus Xenobia bacterium]
MADFPGARLLVVDDEPDLELLIRHAFRRQIRTSNWHVEFALNGLEALRRVQAGYEFDALLTDINMPVMDGLTLLRELDALDRDTKVVV